MGSVSHIGSLCFVGNNRDDSSVCSGGRNAIVFRCGAFGSWRSGYVFDSSCIWLFFLANKLAQTGHVCFGHIVGGFPTSFFTGLSMTGVAVGTVVAIGSAPIFAGLLGWMVRKERPGQGWTVATIMAIMGCTLLFVSQGEMTVHYKGILFSMGAGASYANYTVVSKDLLEKHHPYAVIAVVFCLSAVLLAPLAVRQVLAG